ncbi:hypothetical protein FQZ97_1191780 [compost metagenome]
MVLRDAIDLDVADGADQFELAPARDVLGDLLERGLLEGSRLPRAIATVDAGGQCPDRHCGRRPPKADLVDLHAAQRKHRVRAQPERQGQRVALVRVPEFSPAAIDVFHLDV